MRTLASVAAALLSLTIQSGVFAEHAPKADNTAQNNGADRKDAVTAEQQGHQKDQVKVYGRKEHQNSIFRWRSDIKRTGR